MRLSLDERLCILSNTSAFHHTIASLKFFSKNSLKKYCEAPYVGEKSLEKGHCSDSLHFLWETALRFRVNNDRFGALATRFLKQHVARLVSIYYNTDERGKHKLGIRKRLQEDEEVYIKYRSAHEKHTKLSV